MAQKSAPPITIQHVAIADLRPDPRNPRVMPELERDALDRSIDEFGLVEPVVVHRFYQPNRRRPPAGRVRDTQRIR